MGIAETRLPFSGPAKTPTRRRAWVRPRDIRPATYSRARGVIRTRTQGRRSARGGFDENLREEYKEKPEGKCPSDNISPIQTGGQNYLAFAAIAFAAIRRHTLLLGQ